MSTLYIETSAVLAWLLGESVSHRVVDTINRHETIVSSVLLIVETGRAIIRAENEGMIDAGGHQRLKGLFAEHSTGWSYLKINSLIRKRAAKPFPIEPIRSPDAIHLSTALEFLQIYPDLVVLSFDKRILDNFVPLGLNSA